MKKKIITINEDFLNIQNEKKTKPKKKKQNTLHFNPTKAKKELLKKIQNYRKEKQRQEVANTNYSKHLLQEEFKNDFKDSLEYLKQVIKKRKEKKHKKPVNEIETKTTPQLSISNQQIANIPQQNPNITNTGSSIQSTETLKNIKKDPPYGILKGGSKPTFRQYYSLKHKPHMTNHKTLKQNKNEKDKDILKIKVDNTIKNKHDSNNTLSTRQKVLHSIKQAIQQPKHSNEKNKKMRKYKIKTIKKKYKLGKSKHGGSNHLSILIKNNKTIKKIKDELLNLNRTPILDIKNFLKEKHLIYTGSKAPDHILREIYKQAILSGDVSNKNPDIMIHNYLA